MAITSRPIIVEHNIETNEIIEREMNDAEYEKYLIDKANTEANSAAINQKDLQRQAILDRLGLTEEEAKLLLG